MSHKKHITKNLIALIIIGAIFSGTISVFGDFSPNTLKTFIPYGPEASTSRIAFGPPAGMGINVTELTNLPNVVNVMNKMGYQIPTLTNFATSVQPYMSEIEADTPSTELMSVIMSINPAGYVASAEGTTIIAELKEDLNTGKEITNLFKSLGCASGCDNLDNHYQAGIDKLQTQRPYFAGLNLSDFIKDAIKIAPGLVPSEKPENIEDIAKKFEWLIGKSNALEFDNSAIKASLIKLNNLGKDKIIAPSGGGNGGGGGAAIVGGGSAAKAKTTKKELSKDKSSEKSVKKSESKSKSKSEIKSKDKTSKKSVKKSETKSKSEIKSKDKSSGKSVKKSKSKDKNKTSKKSVKKSKSKSKDKSSNKKSTKKSKSKTPSI